MEGRKNGLMNGSPGVHQQINNHFFLRKIWLQELLPSINSFLKTVLDSRFVFFSNKLTTNH